MKKRFAICLLLIAVVLMLSVMPVSADSGPKPSIVISFKGLESETYYVTLLSETGSVGPWSISEEYQEFYNGEDAWDAFSRYKDSDGFNFIGCFEDCSDSDTFKWSYYPPDTFKILIYFPEHDHMTVSAGIYKRYAFDSYFAAVADSPAILAVSVADNELEISRTYDFSWELLSLLCRIVITIMAELGVAFLFGFRTRKQITLICVVNIFTQTVLNILLNFINYKSGAFMFVFNYLWMEFVIFFIEGFILAKLLHHYASDQDQKIRPWLYSFTANVVSFVAGMLIAKLMPGIF